MYFLCLICTETQPPVTNLSVSVENLCTVTWTWNPPEGASPNCSLWYLSHFGNKQDKVSFPEHLALMTWSEHCELEPRISQILILLQSGIFFFFFWLHLRMWKFLGQGSNLRHSSAPSHCSDNAASLTCCISRELPKWDFCFGLCPDFNWENYGHNCWQNWTLDNLY